MRKYNEEKDWHLKKILAPDSGGKFASEPLPDVMITFFDITEEELEECRIKYGGLSWQGILPKIRPNYADYNHKELSRRVTELNRADGYKEAGQSGVCHC